ncbi:hypothetical protein Halhy_2864 [Haliscomenobacter hydrossis DSM 1100]|uniref:Uncharacterized protein n=1 Tax=Haliscomenobacter hydrossis (strain ATCC 27775 / DSM 1100 / LMG 10767 / O) TaxID=760192 RepID=F4L431_HALH1|nr:hypothetical protein Halhy_2864 [Haliscomenobacter hydrossis DSM 1100]
MSNTIIKVNNLSKQYQLGEVDLNHSQQDCDLIEKVLICMLENIHQ